MHSPDCSLCANLDRATAYRYMGIPNIIPLSHGSQWLSHDLTTALMDLTVDNQVTLDYTGQVPDAPRITFTQGEDGTIAAMVTTDAGRNSLLWWPATTKELGAHVVYDVLDTFKKLQNARGVTIVPYFETV